LKKKTIAIILFLALILVFILIFNTISHSENIDKGKIVLRSNKEKITVQLPDLEELEKSDYAVTGFLNLTKQQEKAREKEKEQIKKAAEKGKDELPIVTVDNIIYDKDYTLLYKKDIYKVSVSKKDATTIQYELCNKTYTKDTLKNINDDVKELKNGNLKYLYTINKVENLNNYYVICNKIKNHSVFVTITSIEELNKNEIIEYMTAINF